MKLRDLADQMVVPALAIVSALIVGALVIVLSDADAMRALTSGNIGSGLSQGLGSVSDAYRALVRSSLGSQRAIGETLVATTPLLFAGLGFALAFKAGLFNIGAEGQLLAGTICAGYVGFTYDLPGPLHVTLAVLAAFVGGAIWGAIPGLLRARTGAHEVISTIMLNYIALRLVDYLLTTETFLRPGRQDPISKPVADTAQLPTLIPGTRANLGIVLALVAAWAVWWLLFRSTIGFQLRAVGANSSAATYAGISVGGSWILAMAIAGGLAGIGGSAALLGVQTSITGGFSNVGFDAIALALLGRSHPVGVVLASLMFGILRAGGVGMQAATSTPIDIIVVIQGLVIGFVAAPALVRAIYRLRSARFDQDVKLAVSWGN